MSNQDPPTQRSQNAEQSQQYRIRPIELERSPGSQPELRWISVKDPNESFLLEENDYVLDSHFNPQFDVWEVLIRLGMNSPEE
jgi:hypothetical protein